MSFCNAYVKSPVGHLFHQDIHGTACRHGWCDAYYLGILLSQFKEGFAENILKAGRHVAGIGNDLFARFLVEFSGACHTVADRSAGLNPFLFFVLI